MLNTLYSYDININLTFRDGTLGNEMEPNRKQFTENYPMSNNAFVVHKGANQVLNFFIRSLDRKAVVLVGKVLKIIVSNPDNGEVVLDKVLNIVDEYKGTANLTINMADTQTWSLGGYNYTVFLTDQNDYTFPLFTDMVQSCTGHMTLKAPLFQSSLNVQSFNPLNFAIMNYGWNTGLGEGNTRRVSSAIKGNVNRDLAGSYWNSIKVYMDNFSGNIYIQKNDHQQLSNSNNDSNPDGTDWKYIKLDEDLDRNFISVMNTTGVTEFVLKEDLVYWRIMLEPIPGNQGHTKLVTYELKKAV